VDSLLAVKDLIYGKKLYTAEEFISALEEQDVRFLTRLRSCPSYGTGDVEANDLIHSLTKRFYSYYKDSNFEMGCGFFPTSHQFQRHVPEGKAVGHTPDGRKAGQPLADSIAAVNGKAVKGPTLMLSSAACYSQDRIYGIPVLNLSITRKFNTSVLRALIEGYFDMGGTQIQITCVDKETLLDAKKNPDAYRDLVVRVGGYSEYFVRLSPALKQAVLDRNIHELN
jgi:formate C-acetyltransferase